jgi:hypothetical protein
MASGLSITPVAARPAFRSHRRSAFRSRRRRPSSQARWPSSTTRRPDPLLPGPASFPWRGGSAPPPPRDPAASHHTFDLPRRFPSPSGVGSGRGGTVRRRRHRIRSRWHRAAAEVPDPAVVAPCGGRGPPSSKDAPPSSGVPSFFKARRRSFKIWQRPEVVVVVDRWRCSHLSVCGVGGMVVVVDWWGQRRHAVAAAVAAAAVGWWCWWGQSRGGLSGGGGGGGGLIFLVIVKCLPCVMLGAR